MNTGEIVRDGQGHNYEIGPILGRGLWGKTFSVRTHDGMEWALKVPLTPKDLPTGKEKLAQASRKILNEMGDILTEVRAPQLLVPRKKFTTQEGVPCLLYPRNDNTLERRLNLGSSMREVLAICVQLVQALDALPVSLKAHGNLHPRNVFISERGLVQLSDPITPTLAKHYHELRKARNWKNPYAAPELRRMDLDSPQQVFVDTYSIAMILYHGTSGDNPSLPLEGLDKVSRVSLQDKVQSRLQEEKANPRFHARLAASLARFLNRALSEKSEPSPPFRFHTLGTFGERINFLHNLIDPTVTHVGQILLDRPPASKIYSTGEEIRFSCTIDCAPKLENFEEVLCGLKIFERSKNERIRGIDCEYTVDSHPTGRLRFGFTIRSLPPAQYRVQIAFKVRDSSAEPMLADGDFEVHPEPGWVPPRPSPDNAPIPINPDAKPSDFTPAPQPPTLNLRPRVELVVDEHSSSVEVETPSDSGIRKKRPIITLEDDDPPPESEEEQSSTSGPRITLKIPDPQRTTSPQPAVIDLSNRTHIEQDSVDEPEYTGPSGLSDNWNDFRHDNEKTGELELSSHSEISEDSEDDSPTIMSSIIMFIQSIFSDFFGVFIFGGVIVIIILFVLLYKLNG